MEEVWKVKEGFSNYMISNLGRVVTIRKSVKEKYGYLTIRLVSDDKKQKDFSVHRLVGELFCDNPNGYSTINHIDCNKENNVYTNLEWVTQKMNVDHAISNGVNKKFKNSKNICVDKLDNDGNIIESYHSMMAAAKSIGVNTNKIRNCCIGISKTSGGYGWQISKEQIENRRDTDYIIHKFSLEGKLLNSFNNLSEASRDCGVKKDTIMKCVNGKQITSGGFIWCYDKDLNNLETILKRYNDNKQFMTFK